MFQHVCSSCFALFSSSALAKQITDNRAELAMAIHFEVLKEVCGYRWYLAKMEHHYMCIRVYFLTKEKMGHWKMHLNIFFSCQLSRTQSGTSVGSGKKDSVLSAEVS